MNNLSHLELREFFNTAKEGDFHIYNVPDSEGVVRKETKLQDNFLLEISENGKFIAKSIHENPIR